MCATAQGCQTPSIRLKKRSEAKRVFGKYVHLWRCSVTKYIVGMFYYYLRFGMIGV